MLSAEALSVGGEERVGRVGGRATGDGATCRRARQADLQISGRNVLLSGASAI